MQYNIIGGNRIFDHLGKNRYGKSSSIWGRRCLVPEGGMHARVERLLDNLKTGSCQIKVKRDHVMDFAIRIMTANIIMNDHDFET